MHASHSNQFQLRQHNQTKHCTHFSMGIDVTHLSHFLPPAPSLEDILFSLWYHYVNHCRHVVMCECSCWMSHGKQWSLETREFASVNVYVSFVAYGCHLSVWVHTLKFFSFNSVLWLLWYMSVCAARSAFSEYPSCPRWMTTYVACTQEAGFSHYCMNNSLSC